MYKQIHKCEKVRMQAFLNLITGFISLRPADGNYSPGLGGDFCWLGHRNKISV